MLAGPSEAVRPTLPRGVSRSEGFPNAAFVFRSLFLVHHYQLNRVIVAFFFFFFNIGQYLQNAANTFISKTLPLRCFAAFSGCGIGRKKKRALRRARFSELLRILLIDREHLSHSDTLAYQKKKGCFGQPAVSMCVNRAALLPVGGDT